MRKKNKTLKKTRKKFKLPRKKTHKKSHKRSYKKSHKRSYKKSYKKSHKKSHKKSRGGTSVYKKIVGDSSDSSDTVHTVSKVNICTDPVLISIRDSYKTFLNILTGFVRYNEPIDGQVYNTDEITRYGVTLDGSEFSKRLVNPNDLVKDANGNLQPKEGNTSSLRYYINEKLEMDSDLRELFNDEKKVKKWIQTGQCITK